MGRLVSQLRLYIAEIFLGWSFKIANDLWSNKSLIIFSKLIQQMKEELND